jgi:chemotaxis protein MotB
MARRNKKHPPHANHERWIVSYADFVTLLFAFFVVMFATANADRGKASTVAAAVRAALDQGQVSDVVRALSNTSGKIKGKQESSAMSQMASSNTERDLTPDKEQHAARMAQALLELLPSMELLEKELKPEIQKGTVELHMEPRGLAISFKQAAFFDSGSSGLKQSSLPTIGKVGAALLKVPNQVRLEGHTDDIPIHNDRFRSNWELSAARAIAVLEVLDSAFHVPRDRMAIGGYADVAPIASNDTDAGRARNRRVDVVILSELGASTEPTQRPIESTPQTAAGARH